MSLMYRDGLNLSRETFLVLKNTGQIFQLGATKRQNELQDLRKSNQAHLSKFLCRQWMRFQYAFSCIDFVCFKILIENYRKLYHIQIIFINDFLVFY